MPSQDNTIEDVIIHLEGAITALTNEGWILDPVTGKEIPIPSIECCIADDLERIEATISAKGKTLLFALASEIRRALVDVEAAKQKLSSLEKDM